MRKSGPQAVPLRIKFWSRIDVGFKNQCWPWRTKRSRGYASYKHKGHKLPAAKTAWELAFNKKWPRGKMVCHSCNFRPCCNPWHVYPGDHSTNAKDWWATRGSKHPPATIKKMRKTHLKRHRLKREQLSCAKSH